MRDYLNNIREQMKPKYHEITAYLTALTCAVLFVVNPEFRQFYFEILSGAGAAKASLAFMTLGLIATIGFFYSFLHIFIKRKKSVLEKTCMGMFIMGANGMAGVLTGIEMLPSRWSPIALIPIWNILIGMILLYQIGLSKFEITDENASPTEVVGASIILFIVFAIIGFRTRLTWAMTFSICLFYSSTIFFLINWIIYYFRLRSIAET